MAQLAPVVDKLEDVPEPVRAFYVQKDGKFHVDLSGTPAGFASASDLAAANARLIEFRDTNVNLLKEVEPLRKIKEALGDVDPATAKSTAAELAALKASGVAKPGDIATQIQAAVQAAMEPVVKENAALKSSWQADRERADAGTLRTAIGEHFTKAGGVADALDFVLGRAKGIFVVENGVAKTAPNVFSADKPGEPLSISEWMAKMVKESSFAFKPSTGGGASPQSPGGGAGAVKPGQIVLIDPTPQQLGEHAKDIAAGKMVVRHSQTA